MQIEHNEMEIEHTEKETHSDIDQLEIEHTEKKTNDNNVAVSADASSFREKIKEMLKDDEKTIDLHDDLARWFFNYSLQLHFDEKTVKMTSAKEKLT